MTSEYSGQQQEASSPERAELDRLRSEHATVVRALREAIRDTTRLTRLFAVLNEAAPLEKLLDRVLATLSELFLSDIVVLLDATGDAGLVPLAAIGLPAGTEQETIAHTDGGYAEAALSAGSPIAVTEAQADPKVDLRLRELDAETGVWLPVAGDEGTRRGVLILARCRPIPFSHSDIALLSAMAYRIGLLVERAHAEQVRRMLEAKLSFAQKTESLGRMAAAVAHHFNNTLAVVVTSLDLALEDLPVTHGTRDDLVRAREAAMRAAKTGELMLAYIGQSTGNHELLDLTTLVSESLKHLQGAIPANVRLITDFSVGRLVVSANAPQITQLLSHLITNACEAIGLRAGELRVSLRTLPGTEITDSCYPGLDSPRPKAASYACLEVSDSGCGIARETIEKIFDPFFTTKFVGRGLGLPVVLGTVRSHDGKLMVESVLDHGTTLRVLLPLSRTCAPILAATTATKPISRTIEPGLVLLAEDEAALRRSTKRILKRMGYEVIVAADGIEAVDLFRQRVDEVQIVVLDIAMPRLDGWGALERIRAMRPDIPVILASGYDQAHALDGRPICDSLVYLHKPYTLVDLRNAVDRFRPRTEQVTPLETHIRRSW